MRKLIWAVTGGIFLASSMPSLANLDAGLHQMWSTATTQAQVIDTQSRKGIMGGSYDARWPVKTYNLMSIDPPRIDAGCGGISLYAGAFSFIKLDEFKKMLRNIGSAAEGYFFKLALKAICNDCATTLADLQDIINKINSMNINSCKAGADIVSAMANQSDLVKSKIGEQKLNYAATYNAIWSKADLVEAQKAAGDDPSTAVKEASETASGADNEEYPLLGNIVWRKLLSKNTADLFNNNNGFGGTFSNDSLNYYFMSILGTKIYSKEADSGGGACPAGKTCTSEDPQFNPKLSLKQLVEGNPAGDVGIKYYKCRAAGEPWNGCLNLEEATLDFKGADAYVNKMLYGTDTGSVPSTGSIVDKLKNPPATGLVLGPNETTFINMVPFPILRFFLEAQGVQGGIESVAYMAKPYVVKAMTYRLASSIRFALGSLYDGKQGTTDQNKPAQLATFEKRLDAFDADIRLLYEDMEKERSSFYAKNDFVKQMRQFSGNAFLSLK